MVCEPVSFRTAVEPGPPAEENLAQIAHELRQPLTTIVAALRVLAKCGDTPTVERTSRTIERQVVHLSRLIDDLLDAIRIRRGNFNLHRTRLDARKAVEAAVDGIRPISKQLGQHLDVLLPPLPAWLDADPERLQQILSNLLSNALKHTAAGQRVWVAVDQDYASITLTVGDTGDGIPLSVLPRIFEMFARAPGQHAAGFGIGLAVVKQLAELHGGTVDALSDGPGHGSRFVVTLPRARVAALVPSTR
jgi:two-component system CheB/CheR fusion protein